MRKLEQRKRTIEKQVSPFLKVLNPLKNLKFKQLQELEEQLKEKRHSNPAVCTALEFLTCVHVARRSIGLLLMYIQVEGRPNLVVLPMLYNLLLRIENVDSSSSASESAH